MNLGAHMLKAAEAAVVASVELGDVNWTIDEGILPAGFFSLDDGRRVLASGCGLISFYFESAAQLTAAERLFAIRETARRLTSHTSIAASALLAQDWIVRDRYLTIDLAPFIQKSNERLQKLAAALEMIVSDPEILGGELVIRGTRIPVYHVSASVEAGDTVKQTLADYPSLTPEAVELARIYAQAYAPGKRSQRARQLPAGAIIISDKRIPRHAAAE